MAIKVSLMGAGSIGFTRGIVRDILCVPELRDARFSLIDINADYLDKVHQLIRRDIESAGFPARVEASTDRREALRDSDYVFAFVRVGGLEAWQRDIDIPLKYGVDQSVGDTLAPGGISYAQRTIPVMLDFCRDIREVCKPDCLFINHTNPMAMNSWACFKYGGVRYVGLCHGVAAGRGLIARVLGVPHHELDITAAGVNHQTWYIGIRHRGEDLTGKLLEAMERDPEASRREKVRIDMLRRFGCFSTESNGHLSEYLPWYRKRPHEIMDWIDLGDWIDGETGGALRVCTEGRHQFDHDFPRLMQEPPMSFEPGARGGEHGSWIIESLETGRVYRGHFNVANNGCITNLPPDAVVEVPGFADRNGIGIPRVGDLPPGCAAVCNATISVQRLAVEAAVAGDELLLKQAMMMDPLTGACLNPPEIWQMTDELLLANAQWLPQYGPAVERARTRFEAGGLIPTREGNRGAARRPVRSPGEIRDR